MHVGDFTVVFGYELFFLEVELLIDYLLREHVNFLIDLCKSCINLIFRNGLMLKCLLLRLVLELFIVEHVLLTFGILNDRGSTRVLLLEKLLGFKCAPSFVGGAANAAPDHVAVSIQCGHLGLHGGTVFFFALNAIIQGPLTSTASLLLIEQEVESMLCGSLHLSGSRIQSG